MSTLYPNTIDPVVDREETSSHSDSDLSDTLRGFISRTFASHLDLTVADIFEPNLTLSEIIEKSDKLQNSIDLMEAFAKTANSLKREYGMQVRLPALALDTPVSEVLDIFMEEANSSNAL